MPYSHFHSHISSHSLSLSVSLSHASLYFLLRSLELNNNNKSSNVMACFQSGSIGHQFAISIVLLSIVLLSPGHALPRPAPIVGALSAPTQLLLSELLAAERAPAEDSVYYSEQLVSTLRTLLASSRCQLCIAFTHRSIHNSCCTTTCNNRPSRCRHSITSSTSGPRCVICC